MNYLALAQWIETIAEREQLGPPWVNGSPEGMSAILAMKTEPDLIRAINRVGQHCDWFTGSTFITVFVEYLREAFRPNSTFLADIPAPEVESSVGVQVDIPV